MRDRKIRIAVACVLAGVDAAVLCHFGGIWRTWSPVPWTRAARLLLLFFWTLSVAALWLHPNANLRSALRERRLVHESVSFKLTEEAHV